MRSAIGAHRKLRPANHGAHSEVSHWRPRDGDKIFVRSAIGAHRIVRPDIAALIVRSDIGAHRILVRPAIAALTVWPVITALTGY